MAFASIHVPDFLIQALVRSEPAPGNLTLNNLALSKRAIALVDGTPPLWKVIAASEAALRAGIQMGMAKSQAAQFCDLEIRHRSPAQERAAHAALLDLGWSMSPRIEDTAPHTILADVAGLASLFGSAANIAREFVARAARFGLFANIAIASNIEASLLASRGFAGITLIPPGEEARQLGDLPVETLPAAPETLEILDRWGVRTCAALAALPLLDLSERLGQEGVRLHELARGANNRSLVLAQTSLTFEEEMALDDSVEELEPLSFILGRLLDQLCARLNARALAIQSIRVRFELEPAFENGIQRLKDESSRPGAQKPAAKTYEKSLSLPVPMRDSKTLLKLLRLHLQSAPPGAPILKVTISAEPAAPRSAQGGLFVPASPHPEKLELTVARLAHLVGDANVGSPELVDTHRPGEFRIARFRPANLATEARSSSSPRKKKNPNFSSSDANKPICHPEPTTTTTPSPQPPACPDPAPPTRSSHQPPVCHPEQSVAARLGPQSAVEGSAFSFSSGHGFSRADQQPQKHPALAAEVAAASPLLDSLGEAQSCEETFSTSTQANLCQPERSVAAPSGPQSAVEGSAFSFKHSAADNSASANNAKSLLGGRSFSSDNKTGAQRPSTRGDFSASLSVKETDDDASPSTETKRPPLTAFRAFRPAPPAKVDLHNSRPARVAFNGQLATVVVASGPWRTSGDWWREDTWQHDEWDLELRFEAIRETAQKSGRRTRSSAVNLAPQIPPNGVYCLYFDTARQTWFVRGIYD